MFVPVADAAIVYDSSVNTLIGLGSPWTLNLPGDADLFVKQSQIGSFNFADALQAGVNSPYVRFQAKHTSGYFFLAWGGAGKTWNNIGGTSVRSYGNIGVRRSTMVIGPGSFAHQYAAFRFKDSTQGNAVRYGWVEMSMDLGGFSGPDVTIHAWGYDDTGATIAMGAVPEPTAAAAATGAALVLGAAGVRAWRRRCQQRLA